MRLVLVFSKILSGLWPSFSVVGRKVSNVMEEAESGMDLEDLAERFGAKAVDKFKTLSPTST